MSAPPVPPVSKPQLFTAPKPAPKPQSTPAPPTSEPNTSGPAPTHPTKDRILKAQSSHPAKDAMRAARAPTHPAKDIARGRSDKLNQSLPAPKVKGGDVSSATLDES